MFLTSEDLDFYTDASGTIGYGCFFMGKWTCGIWSKALLKRKPSIEFQELFALVAGILTWENDIKLVNSRVIIYCDNQAVVSMINNTSSSCSSCMKLIRILVLNCLKFNRRISVRYVKSAENILADSLSRQKWDIFWLNAPAYTEQVPDVIPDCLFPIEKFLDN